MASSAVDELASRRDLREGSRRGLKAWEKPQVINTDKAPTCGIAISELKAEGKCPEETVHRQVKYLNNVIEASVVEAHHGKLNQVSFTVIHKFRGLVIHTCELEQEPAISRKVLPSPRCPVRLDALRSPQP